LDTGWWTNQKAEDKGMTDRKRKFEVSGLDAEGDVRIFRTDDRQKAEDMESLMAEDLEDVEVSGDE
jgi:hypothetical protein